MTTPKPGDRVRVTYEAEVTYVGLLTHVSPVGGADVAIPAAATVEVLASPVYVNHDTTERRDGDVARDRCGVVWVRAVGGWLNPLVNNRYRGEFDDPNGGDLTLLVRDGEVVT
jgi:hypothetical protein